MDGKSMRQVRQDAPASRLPQDGQASNSASGARALIDTSCRNAPTVVTAIAADYHLHMAAMHSTETFRVVDRAVGCNRLWLRSEGGDRITHIAASGYRGPSLPETITNPVLHREEGPGSHRCRLETDQGRFEFESASIERIEARPMLFAGLHRPFALNTIDRLAVRFLLMLLRLPGGAGLLRRWHASRIA